MRLCSLLSSVILAAIVVSGSAHAQDILSAARDGELVFGPFIHQVFYEEVPVDVPASVFATFGAKPGKIRIGARIVADLGDLQENIKNVVKLLPLPSDNCDHSGPDNLVLKISDPQLTSQGSRAILGFRGDADIWLCQPPLKTRLVRQPFKIALPFRLSTLRQQLTLMADKPEVELKGDLAILTDNLLRIGGFDLSSEVRRLLEKTLAPIRLEDHLPAGLLALGPKVTAARFFSQAGSLGAEVEVEVRLDRDALLQGKIQPAVIG